MIFSHINRFDSLKNLNQIKKIWFCIFRIDVCSQCISRIRCIIFSIDFLIIFRLFHIINIFYELSTIKSHKYSIIDVAKSIWKFWNTMMLSNQKMICILVIIALLKHKILVLWCIFYSILNIKCFIDAIFREETNSKILIF